MIKFRIAGLLTLCTLVGCASDSVTYAPGETGAVLVDGLAIHDFPITTDSAEAQQWFNQGLILLYGFNHDAAIRAFTESAARDPDAAMAWWGIAYANGMHINVPQMTEAQWRASHDAATRAIAELDDESELERMLVNAVAARTAWPPPEAQRPYDEAFAAAMEQVHRAHSNNVDVAVLYAESLMNLQPWDYWTEDGRTKHRADEIIAVLENARRIDPMHPQAAHLYIHATEAGPTPEQAEAAADMLMGRTIAAGHLVHMPSHLYARVGRYDDAVLSNIRAVAADDAFFEIGTDPGVYYIYHAHNLHFLCFASMMEGRYEPAIAAARRLERAMPDPVLDQFAFLVEGVIPSTRHAMIRFGRWDELLALEAPPEKRPLMRAIHHYGRGIAFSALGQTSEARSEAERFETYAARVPQDWWVFSNKAHDVLPIARHMLAGELAYREGRLDDAWAELTRAVEYEDRLVYDEPPGWMIPVRHAMGALLLEAGEARRAERLYREDQIDHPGNGWSLLGLQQALEAQGRDAEAQVIAVQLDGAWRRVEERPTSSCYCAPASE